MIKMIQKHKFLILRRATQLLLLMLYVGANAWGWSVLQGNLSSSLIFGLIPMSDPYAVLQIFSTGSLLAMDAVIGAFIAASFYFVIGGRGFCAWVCPVNMVTDFANYLRRVFLVDKIEKRFKPTRALRYWVMGLSFVLSFFLGIAAFELISPIAMMHRGIIFGMGFGYAALLAIFLFDLFVVKNGWCGHVCPLGAFYSLLARFSLVRVKHNQPSCTLCMKCKTVCPEKEVLFMVGKQSGSIKMGECSLCARCIEVCDDDALNFSIRDFLDKEK